MDDQATQNQIAENFRFYGDMRFKQLTLFMAAMTAAGAGLMQFPGNRWPIALCGLYVSWVMWIVEVRATLNAIAAHNAIPQVFRRQKDRLYPWLNASWAVLSLHIVCYGSWLWGVTVWHPGWVFFCIGALAGTIAFVFSVRSYWKQRAFWLNDGSKLGVNS